MTRHAAPTEPLDAQERELSRILRALPGGEPPARLDASILRAAADAAAASRRPHARWLASMGSMWGIGGAAAAVLALGVAWQVGNPEQMSAPSPGASAVSSAPSQAAQAEDSAVSVEFKERAPAELDASPPPPPPPAVAAAPERRERMYSGAPRAARVGAEPAATPLPEPFAADALDEHVTSPEAGAAAASAPVAAAPAASVAAEAGQSKPYAAKSAVSDAAAQLAEAQANTAAAAAEGSLSGLAATRSLKPVNWLAEIRILRDADRQAEAKASLLEFRRRYPDYVIPSDLLPLLRE